MAQEVMKQFLLYDECPISDWILSLSRMVKDETLDVNKFTSCSELVLITSDLKKVDTVQDLPYQNFQTKDA